MDWMVKRMHKKQVEKVMKVKYMALPVLLLLILSKLVIFTW